ncbi:TetR/AcrR family transcriptional regulator [uncultured Algoriphagus sp.]|uniref:TetR/AcrR family transcriptional regulator n=1 Tax=uncultured Algoriphagus sp. TaxID=417365 RepID=UPI002599D651|nr:TetR/AcrR family transcriptional regulator [uncultured Algoriphagus sp.]
MKEAWIEEGYRQFALNGPKLLSINSLSEKVGISRASFYHHFGDMDVFIQELLMVHWKIVTEFNESGKSVKRLFPDFYQFLAEYPIPLQFNMQLFHNRSIPEYNLLFIKNYEASAKSFLLDLFAKQFALSMDSKELYDLWLTVGEAWYSRITKDDLSASCLQAHGEEIMTSVMRLTKSQLYSTF